VQSSGSVSGCNNRYTARKMRERLTKFILRNHNLQMTLVKLLSNCVILRLQNDFTAFAPGFGKLACFNFLSGWK